ncbi:MAG TPA: sodium/glutamate symporter [Erysipelotrichaceae bacterium]|nr:sodium/glutamate symporter [Erysipelotrichaceae bacterium]
MTLTFDIVQTLGIAVLVFGLGRLIKNKVPLFKKYFIPAPVIGGIIFSTLAYIVFSMFNVSLKMDNVLQDFFMNIFFTAIGFSVSFKLILKSGKQGAILAVVAVILLFIQNGVGAGLASLFGLNPLLGVSMGSVSMSGGVGSAAAFGPTFESLGAEAATTVGVAAATFGLFVGSLVGGPVAKRLIDRYKLKSEFADKKTIEKESDKLVSSEGNIFNTILVILLAAAGGTFISYLLSLTGLTFPYYVGCLFGGTVARNLADSGYFKIREKEVSLISNVALNLFLSMTLMSLNIAKLIGLAIPMLVILLTQTIVMMVYAYYITFGSMGKSYDAAVMAAGHCGVGLGQTPNAIANMASVIEEHGAAPNAWFVLPVITVVFINIFNPLVITYFMNLLS